MVVKSSADQSLGDQPKPKTVHVVVSNHLDIGFHSNDEHPGSDKYVLDQYMKHYLPAAIATAQELKDRTDTKARLRYMTHSYLVSLYLDCPKRLGIYCPTPEEIETFKTAIKQGDIHWHAFPHNAQLELFDPDLMGFTFQYITHALDQQFGLPPKITMSQRDVPGFTRAALPILAYQGVKALSVGVNGGSAPPGVPMNKPFIWRDEASGAELVAFWHPGGYANYILDEEEVQGDRSTCIELEGFDHILCTAWRGDNLGPPTSIELIALYERLEQDFPGSELIASTFDDYINLLLDALPSLPKQLPVVTGEIGDSWIYGISSDPGKVAEFKALLRTRKESQDRWDDPNLIAFSRMLVKIPEHTWGTDTKADPGDYKHWSNAQLQRKLREKDVHFKAAVDAWKRQRRYIQWALEELYSSPSTVPLVSEYDDDDDENGKGESSSSVVASRNVVGNDKLRRELERMHEAPDVETLQANGFENIPHDNINNVDDALVFHSHAWAITLDRHTGNVIGLEYHHGGSSNSNTRDDTNGKNTPIWSTQNCSMPGIVYSTYTQADYDTIWNEYAYQSELADWFIKDFSKPGCDQGGAKRRDVSPVLDNVWHKRTGQGGLHLLIRSRFDPEVVQLAGAPEHIWLEILSPEDSDDLHVDVIWVNKTSTRLPESLWVRWKPDPVSVDSATWRMQKLGQAISPLEVIRNGSFSQHAVGDDGVSVQTNPPPLSVNHNSNNQLKMHIRSLDAALVSPGLPTPFPNVRHPPDMDEGMSFSLVNNIWGTNYVMWYPYQDLDATMRFRFIIQMEDKPSVAVV